MIVLTAVGTAVLAIGGLIGWGARITLPRLLESFEQRNAALFQIYAKIYDAVEKIPSSIASFEKAILGLESRMNEKLEDTKNEVITEIKDQKMKDLTAKIDSAVSVVPKSSRASQNNLERYSIPERESCNPHQ